MAPNQSLERTGHTTGFVHDRVSSMARRLTASVRLRSNSWRPKRRVDEMTKTCRAASPYGRHRGRAEAFVRLRGSSHLTRHVAPSVPCQSRSSQPVSTQALGEVHRRMTPGIGAPQVGQRAVRGSGGERGGGWPSRGWAGTIMRRMDASGMAQLAWRKPQWRTVMKP